LDERDEGTSYNGGAQSPFFTLNVSLGWGELEHGLNRSYGDAKRGGGPCVVHKTPTTCSGDATCTTSAKAQYGSAAWGYCYQSRCYMRPGSQSSHCVMNPNRC